MLKIIVALSLVAYALAGDNCGTTVVPPNPEGISGRVVNGVEATPHSWPWMAAMCLNSPTTLACPGFNCGASIVRQKFLLTAAHCIIGKNARTVKYKIGGHSLQSNEQNGQQMMQVARFISHADYQSPSEFLLPNDIGIVELEDPIQYNDNISPICLAGTDDHLTEGMPSINIGWGSLRGGGGPYPDTLMQVRLVFHDRPTCDELYTAQGRRFHSSVTCAGGEPDQKALCYGDSGSPHFMQDPVDNKYYQYGVTSHITNTQSCYVNTAPIGFARVSVQCEDFIGAVVGQDVCLTPPGSHAMNGISGKFKHTIFKH